jgi:PAS domain S-box-containing protein
MMELSDEWLCREIVREAQDAIIYSDREGVIRLWNSGATAIFGFTDKEAVGQSLDLIIPERLRKRHREGYDKVMRTGSTRYGQNLLAVPAIRRDGSTISIEFSIALLHSPAGQVVGSAAIIRDVTARWQQEKALKKLLEACEEK